MPIRMKVIILSVAVAASVISSTTAIAKIYKWTDNTGKVHYTAKPPSANNKEKAEEIKIRKKPASSLTHQPPVAAVKLSENKLPKNTRKKIVSSKGDNCSQLINSLPGLSDAEKSAEVSKCEKDISKASDKDKKKTVSASASQNDSGTSKSPIIKRKGKRTSRDIINHFESAMQKRDERRLNSAKKQ
ncbi:MAG: DUF4124 domain-containing protein [Cocleimonas sp.]